MKDRIVIPRSVDPAGINIFPHETRGELGSTDISGYNCLPRFNCSPPSSAFKPKGSGSTAEFKL